MLDERSVAGDEPRICPFLRAIDDDVSLAPAIPRPDQANRCTALGDAAPQSLRQQEHACLTSVHVNCPRYLPGALQLTEPTPVPRGSGLQLTPAIVGALFVLAASFALSVGFVVANGGMDLPAAGGPPQAALESAGSGPSLSPVPTSSASVSPIPTTVAGPSPAPTIPATPASTAPPAPSATPPATPGSSSDRYALLEPCSDTPGCWIYVIRSGDNLVSIARYFGIPLDVVTERNPWTTTTALVAGQELRLPAPTR